MALPGMLAEVTEARVKGLLLERQPDLLDPENPAEVARFEALVKGAAVEVVLLVGPNPPAGPIRDLAVTAVVYQTASEIEGAEYPEQQVQGDLSRAERLHQRYLELLRRLTEILDELGGTIPDDGGSGGIHPPPNGVPRGRSPRALGWPDPIGHQPARHHLSEPEV